MQKKPFCPIQLKQHKNQANPTYDVPSRRSGLPAGIRSARQWLSGAGGTLGNGSILRHDLGASNTDGSRS